MSGKSIEEEDFLDVDREIPGQKFVCISFISPEKVIGRRELFNVHQYLLKKSEDYKLDLKGLESDYDDFVYANSAELEKRFDEEVVPKEFHDGACTMRGVRFEVLIQVFVRHKFAPRFFSEWTKISMYL